MKKKAENPLFVPALEPTDFCASQLLTCFVFLTTCTPGPIAAAAFTRPLIGGIWIKERQLLALGQTEFLLNAAMGPAKDDP